MVSGSQQPSFDLPKDIHPEVIKDHMLLFSEKLGDTNVTNHAIDTGDATPPPHPIPFHYVAVSSGNVAVSSGNVAVSSGKWHMKA